MKKITLIYIFSIIGISTSIAQDINQTDINTTCFVISELMAEAKKNGDTESVLIYYNTIDKIKKKFTVHKTYVNYFDSIKVLNPDIKGIVITLNNPPLSPGFTNNEIENLILFKKKGASLMEFNKFLIKKELESETTKIENINELELKNINHINKEREIIKFKE
ncbi:hypothetical protein [Flammeovirga agarivorans]|uniref:Uncharacterized protein n=1 Tax=Flammeovirga agarivorans TaxID=2726742 RepID=A0A7X8XVU9_9BACT|nr:hypothetical protein [Flammeovirga agarivorans]NLR91682.1 hypothetical protein [Flammeovirga agarivorans]